MAKRSAPGASPQSGLAKFAVPTGPGVLHIKMDLGNMLDDLVHQGTLEQELTAAIAFCIELFHKDADMWAPLGSTSCTAVPLEVTAKLGVSHPPREVINVESITLGHTHIIYYND